MMRKQRGEVGGRFLSHHVKILGTFVIQLLQKKTGQKRTKIEFPGN